MPLVKITTRKDKTASYKKAVLNGVHLALVEALGIPEDDRTQVLHEVAADNFELPPGKSDNATVVEVVMFRGRSAGAKKKLYESVVRRLGASPGIEGSDILIVLTEPPLENWGIRGGKPASELDLGFRVDV